MIDKTVDQMLELTTILDFFWALLPVLCMLSVALTLAFAIFKKNTIIPILLATLFFACFIWKNGAISFDISSDAKAIRIVSLNVGQFQNDTATAKAIANQLSDLDADIVLLQEFGLYHKWPDVQSVAKDFAVQLEKPHYRFEPQKDNIFGVAVFSNYPIDHWQKLFEQSGPTNEAVKFSVVVDQNPIWICNLHLQSFNFLLESTNPWYSPVSEVLQLQQQQAADILSTIEGNSPILIAGDFNATPGMATYEVFNDQFTDLLKKAGIGWRWSLDWIPIRIDHVFVNEAIEIHGAEVISTSSDHHAILCEISI